MRIGLLSESARRRFEYESAILARLTHPAIAQIHEAGTWREPLTDQEVPYFAMEYVEDALPFDEFVRHRALSLREALELFLVVCDAVHHGHQLGVVHRDLKPANVLVDGGGRPKVIDFGIARATDVDLAGVTMHTRTGDVLGTLQYMAPEQLDARPDAVDTRADVYALGVILYEMLAGRPPFDPAGVAITAFARRIRDSEAVLPSSADAGYALEGDDAELDWIVRTAIAADPTERYASVRELAADLGRFLRSEPLTVGPPSRSYHVRKFVRRNRVLVGAIGAVFVVLLLGVAATFWQMLVARDARDDAELQRRRAQLEAASATRQAVKAERINEFLFELLRMGSPHEGRYQVGADVTLREAIDSIAGRLDQLADEPDVEASVRVQLSQAYRSRDDLREAERHARRALELSRSLGDDAGVADALTMLGLAKASGGEPAVALELHREALQCSSRLHGERHHTVAISRLNIGESLTDLEQFAAAERETEAAIAIWSDLDGDHDRFLAIARWRLGRFAARRGDDELAVASYRDALRLFEQADKGWHPFAASANRDLGHRLRDGGDPAGALPHLRRAVEIRARSYGESDQRTSAARYDLAKCLRQVCDYDAAAEQLLAAEPSYAGRLESTDATLVGLLRDLSYCLRVTARSEDAMEFAERAYAGERRARGGRVGINGTLEYGRTLRDVGRLEAAESVFRRWLDRNARSANAPLVENEIAVTLARRGELGPALALCREVARRAVDVVPAESAMWGALHTGHGECQRLAGEHQAAESELLAGLERFEREYAPRHATVLRALGQLVKLYQAWGRPADAERYRRRLETGG